MPSYEWVCCIERGTRANHDHCLRLERILNTTKDTVYHHVSYIKKLQERVTELEKLVKKLVDNK
jgi:hypothetical protein